MVTKASCGTRQESAQGHTACSASIDDVLSACSSASASQSAEQQKIAECLTSLDELIAAQARKLDALKTHKKGLMQQLFPREGETQPRLRFPEFQDRRGVGGSSSSERLPRSSSGRCSTAKSNDWPTSAIPQQRVSALEQLEHVALTADVFRRRRT